MGCGGVLYGCRNTKLLMSSALNAKSKNSKSFIDQATYPIYNSFLLIDKGMTTEACYLSTPGIHLGRGPWKLGPSIIVVEIRDCIVTRIVICVKLDRFLKTWPPIKGARRGRLGTH
jgi:hypothetical protein